LSILLSITEGSDKGSDKDFNRYPMNSLGSLNEVIAGLDIAVDNGYISKIVFDKLFKKATQSSNQKAGFSRKLKNS
jgi:four helix bundle protein